MNHENIITFRLTDQERQALDLMSKAEGFKMSEMLRRLLREGCERRGLSAVGYIDLFGPDVFETPQFESVPA